MALSFSTGKKNKRNWRDMGGDDGGEVGEGTSEGDEAIDEADIRALEADLAQEERQEAEEVPCRPWAT
jgi:hypothetical protein